MDLHLAQTRFLAPTLNALSDAGMNSERLLRRAGLHTFRLYSPDAVVPVPTMLAMFDEIARESNGRGVPREIAQAYRLHAIPGWGDALLACPDVLATIRLATAPQARIMSNNLVTAYLNGPQAIFETGYAAAPSQAQEWVAVLSCLLVLDGFRSGCGPDWLPDEIDIAASDIGVLGDLFDLDRVIVRTNQPKTRIYFRSRDLAKRMVAHEIGASPDSPLPETAMGQLYRLFDSLEPDARPTLDWAASRFDISQRSFQRRLGAEGLTFRAVLDRWRMTKAIELLEDPAIAVGHIAAQLHYSEASHFIRAFHRWTGQSPTRYRDLGFSM
ncbi:helix-turn-helix domain-containing protein [Marimonas sp. MJW-29]|uniref:Helix-turn-helix domain-containing protein n=1 Tax=Sulfitobacter sediminis TaxID=3234186 RepID=A0ABV3RU29_9RHOB